MDRQKRLDTILGELAKSTAAKDSEKNLSDGSMSGRQRLISLFDEGSFVETSAQYKQEGGSPALDYEGIDAGYGSVNGRLTFAYSQDFTKSKGAFTTAQSAKILNIYDLAAKNAAPVVAVLDSAGASIPEGLDIMAGYSAILAKSASLSGVVPQIAVICGICSGSAALLSQSCDFTIIEKSKGRIFINSPFVIKGVEGMDNNVGCADTALKNGLASLSAEGDAGAIAAARQLLMYLPLSCSDELTFVPNSDDANRTTDTLISRVLSDDYDIKGVIGELADDGIFLEISAEMAANIVVGFACINSISVGVVANQPSQGGGVICSASARKAARFIGICDSFNIPVITLADSAGLAISSAEEAALALDCAKLAQAYANASVPKITLICGRAYGTAYAIMGSKGLGADAVFALPTAEISLMPPESAVEFIWKDKIAAGENRGELNEKWSTEVASPVSAAKNGHIDAVIKPEQARQRIAAALEMLSCKKICAPAKKHSNLPL